MLRDGTLKRALHHEKKSKITLLLRDSYVFFETLQCIVNYRI